MTSLLRFSQMGKGRWAVSLGSLTIIGKLFSLLTINLFLPPSQLLIHPFYKFYTNSPRSPALHYVIAKQLMCYNILMVITAILLAVDISIYNFNYTLSHGTQNLLVAANITGNTLNCTAQNKFKKANFGRKHFNKFFLFKEFRVFSCHC